MKLYKLHRIERFPDRQLYGFNLGLEGFIVNGFSFDAEKGSIFGPLSVRNTKIVNAFGIQWKRLQGLLREAISGL